MFRAFTRPKYQVSVYRTIGPLVMTIVHEKNGSVVSKKMPYLRYLICHYRPKETDTVLTLHEIMNWETPEVTLSDIFPDDIFALFQTSGSTGVPKAIAHTHKSFIASAQNLANVIGGLDKIHFNDRYGTTFKCASIL